ncbi:hypothetical protein AV530_005401 [Patagioenas fasciata monilis]|uniref:Uncharacterized protein n=1 Tax=Patagioenas fasciata monilis TaxID=372326 RepID=A0A1V4JL86_PATFA|nr:hypothetical protein AV530_005401 [Patagioenas fasciata monilis]
MLPASEAVLKKVKRRSKKHGRGGGRLNLRTSELLSSGHFMTLANIVLALPSEIQAISGLDKRKAVDSRLKLDQPIMIFSTRRR